MKTVSIDKERTLSTAEITGKWWNSKNLFFSTLAEEDFTNKEVVLTHLILLALLLCIICIEEYPVVAILATGSCGALVKILNKANNVNH